jgi:hypothetical protein
MSVIAKCVRLLDHVGNVEDLPHAARKMRFAGQER